MEPPRSAFVSQLKKTFPPHRADRSVGAWTANRRLYACAGSLILATVENAPREAGFLRLEMGSTLTGVPLYRPKGYVEMERIAVPLANGEALPVIKMAKMVKRAAANPSRGPN